LTFLSSPRRREAARGVCVNDNGMIVGYYVDSNDVKHGFLSSHGEFTTVDDPLGVKGTIVTGINDSEKIVGIYYDSSGAHHGFHLT
jgi:hypothetical protein